MTTLRVLCEKCRHGRVIAVAVTLLALSMPAVAQQAPSGTNQQPSFKVDAQPGATESQLYRWIAATPEEQLAADTTAVPAARRRVRASHDQ